MSTTESIESFMRDYTDRECVLVPSGRIALYIAFRLWLRRGAGMLMSPVNDDVVFFTVLAGGIRPLMAPVSILTGNIGPDSVPDAQWDGIDAVMTTNLHGIPEHIDEISERCKQRELILIEDAAHGFGVNVGGRPSAPSATSPPSASPSTSACPAACCAFATRRCGLRSSSSARRSSDEDACGNAPMMSRGPRSMRCSRRWAYAGGRAP